MVDKETLRKAQLKMVEILDVVDSICVKHNINYWLAYGTLLGAVRHKGFIPWDDDCDICMMRCDYNRFIKIANNELPSNLVLQNHDLDHNYPKKITKIRMLNTKFIEFDESENEAYNQGIFIDIFVYDYYHPIISNILRKINIIKAWKCNRNKYPKGSIKRTAIQIGIIIPYLFYSTSVKILNKFSIFFRDNEKYQDIGIEVSGSDALFFSKNEIFPLKRDKAFEGKFFLVPNNSEKTLSNMYGDYMKLPEPEDRRWHARKIEL